MHTKKYIRRKETTNRITHPTIFIPRADYPTRSSPPHSHTRMHTYTFLSFQVIYENVCGTGDAYLHLHFMMNNMEECAWWDVKQILKCIHRCFPCANIIVMCVHMRHLLYNVGIHCLSTCLFSRTHLPRVRYVACVFFYCCVMSACWCRMYACVCFVCTYLFLSTRNYLFVYVYIFLIVFFLYTYNIIVFVYIRVSCSVCMTVWLRMYVVVFFVCVCVFCFFLCMYAALFSYTCIFFFVSMHLLSMGWCFRLYTRMLCGLGVRVFFCIHVLFRMLVIHLFCICMLTVVSCVG